MGTVGAGGWGGGGTETLGGGAGATGAMPAPGTARGGSRRPGCILFKEK